MSKTDHDPTTRIIRVEITETITRIAHIELSSDEPIDEWALLAELPDNDRKDAIKEQAIELSSESDSSIDEVEIKFIDPEQEWRYANSIDGQIDLEDL